MECRAALQWVGPAVVQTCGKQTSVSDALRYLHTPSIAFQTPGAAPPLNTQPPQPELSLACAVHPFKAGDRDRSVAELLEPEHHSNALLDAAMVLFNQVIEIFRGPQLSVGLMSQAQQNSRTWPLCVDC